MDIVETIRAKAHRSDIAWFVFFLLTGVLLTWLAIVQSLAFLGLVVVSAVIGFVPWAVVRARRIDLEPWQWMLLAALSGYMVLNYGFENLAFHVGGLPFIVSYALMYGCLALAVFVHPNLMKRAFKEPAVLCLVVLILQTLVHLIFDFPHYGLWAVRDSTIFLDGLFLTLGLLWAMKWNNLVILMKWLVGVFIVNLVYSFTLPWGEALGSASPKSGVFQEIPVLGNYRGNVVFLLIGALFCLLLAHYVVRWPRWILMGLAVAQIFGLAIGQSRSMYVGLAVALIVLAFAGKGKHSLKLVLLLCLAMVPLLLSTVSGVELKGRVGTVNMDFLTDHMRSITGERDMPGMSNDARLEWFQQAMQSFYQHPWTGVGFGQPLLDVEDAKTGTAIRMPHNSSLTVLARLGVTGFVFWAIFLLYVFWRFIYALLRRGRCDKPLADIILWLFLVFLTFLIEINVEPGLEFPSGAVPFYFFVGLSLGLIRWQLPSRRSEELSNQNG